VIDARAKAKELLRWLGFHWRASSKQEAENHVTSFLEAMVLDAQMRASEPLPAPPLAFRQRFLCPKCGRSRFGSELLDPVYPAISPMRRHCHGPVGGGCPSNFMWLDADDWMYFLVDGVRLGREDYAALQARIRATPVAGGP